MKNQRQTIRKIVGFLNNEEEDGGFWLPNIQRPFVWSEVQICRLFDSILREYPISTLLVWKTNSASVVASSSTTGGPAFASATFTSLRIPRRRHLSSTVSSVSRACSSA